MRFFMAVRNGLPDFEFETLRERRRAATRRSVDEGLVEDRGTAERKAERSRPIPLRVTGAVVARLDEGEGVAGASDTFRPFDQDAVLHEVEDVAQRGGSRTFVLSPLSPARTGFRKDRPHERSRGSSRPHLDQKRLRSTTIFPTAPDSAAR